MPRQKKGKRVLYLIEERNENRSWNIPIANQYRSSSF